METRRKHTAHNSTSNGAPTVEARLEGWLWRLSRRWLMWVNLFSGMFVVLPWLAPVLMKIGAVGAGRFIYAVYSPLCHQLANRSFFLFGTQPMYSVTELLSYGLGTNTALGLKAFIGTPELGFKVAWSDRMVSMYGGIFLGGLLFALLRRRLRPPGWPILLTLAFPMAVDGVTHVISDLAGLGEGFRYNNAWLATLTGNALARSFYVGNALGSFNSWMRLVSGLLFGFAVVWLVYPLLEDCLCDLQRAEQPAVPSQRSSVAAMRRS